MILNLTSLIFFTLASAGFIIFTVRFRSRPDVRLWGFRFSYVLAFLGVTLLRLSHGEFSELIILIISALVISLVSFEVSTRYLR